MKNLTSLFSHLKGLRYGSRVRPIRDWLVLLVAFTVLLLASLCWNLWLFSQATSGNKIGTATAPQPVEIQLNQVKAQFADRAAQQTKYIQEYRFVDPSR